MRLVFLLCLFFSTTVFAQIPHEKALKMLMAGNRRFVSGDSKFPDRTSERRKETMDKQEPFAAILACSDSRVAPEIIFDLGLGDLFIVRVAGNVVGSLEQESLDYSVFVLNSPLIVVLGHQNCGAVKAVLDENASSIPALAELIQPAVDESAEMDGDKLENATQTNARLMAQKLREQTGFKRLIEQNKLRVKAGYYNFKTGKVEILPN
ncbi:MAG TPA: carbonic anhydrase [Rhabdochlamydiaceae bacterium]|nr:carbonic anhydrase [Rhabdochlamydiaceae bacterium]